MTTEDKKELEIALTNYIALKKSQDECTGFIDGFEVAIKYLSQGQTLHIDSVSNCTNCGSSNYMQVTKLQNRCLECGESYDC